MVRLVSTSTQYNINGRITIGCNQEKHAAYHSQTYNLYYVRFLQTPTFLVKM